MNSTIKRLGFVFCILLAAHPAQAQSTAWTGAAGNGQFSDPGNWTGGVVPTVGSGTVIVDIPATITLPSATTVIDNMAITNTAVTIDGTANSFTTSYLYVDDSGTLNLSMPANGTFVLADASLSSFVGDGQGSGVMNFSGSGTLSLPSTTSGAGIGFGGTGTFNQTSGTVAVTGLLGIGGDGNVPFPNSGTAGGTGVYNISGTSTLTVGFLAIGVGSTTGGTTPTSGLLNITGGEVDASVIDVGVGGEAATDTVTTTTGAITQSAGLLNATDTLSIGTSPGGQATYALSGTGTLTAATFVVGDNSGASGTFTMSGSSTGTVTTAFIVGNSGTGTFNMSGGALTLADGSASSIGSQAGGVGNVNQTGGTITAAGSASLTVGDSGTGSYSLSGGSLTTTTGALTIGNNGTGVFTLSGSGVITTTTGAINIGTGAGTGTFTMTGGTINLGGGMTIGGGAGTGVFNYNGGTLNLTSSIDVESGGTFNQNTDFIPPSGDPVFLGAGGIYNLKAGTLSIGGDFETPGSSGIFATTGAIFNFAGGNVTTTSAWTDELDGAISATSTINTTGGSATLEGSLTGGGNLTVTGGNTVSIDTTGAGNSSAGTWSLNITGNSTVDALATTFTNGDTAIGSGSTFNMATAGNSTLAGAITGAGAFNVNFGAATDTLTLSGASDLTGVTTLAGGGTLDPLKGTFGAIGGTGGVEIGTTSGSGVVTFTGNSTYSGATTVDAGYTLLATNFTGAVTNNGSLGLTGGTVGTMDIGGNLISTGTLLIRTSGTTADLFDVTGSANISGAIALVNPPATTSTNTIVISSGLTLGPLTPASGNRFVAVGITQSGNDVILTTTVNTTSQIAGLSLTSNEAAIAGPLNSLLGNSSHLTPGQFANFSELLNDVGRNGTSNSTLATNLDEIGPESLQYGPTIAILNATSMVQHVDNYTLQVNHGIEGFNATAINVVAPGFDSDMGREMQSMFAYDPSTGFHGSAPNGTNYYPDSSGGTISDSGPPSSGSSNSPTPVGSKNTESDSTVPLLRSDSNSMVLRKPWSRFSAFVGGDVTLADLNQDTGANYAPPTKASYTAVGAVGGVSYRMTNNLSAGILMDYMHTDAETDSHGSRTGINSYSPGLFATFADKGFFVNGLFSFGIDNYNNSRNVPVVGSTANSSPDGTQYVGNLDAGYEFHPAREWTLTPQAGLTYTHIDIDSFTETGASPDNLNVAAQHVDSLRSRLGGTLVYTIHPGQLTLQPSFTAMWQHEFLDNNPDITSNFNDFASQAFTIHSVGMGSDSALLSIGINATLDNSMSIFLNATADLNNEYNAENIVGGFKSSF